jgi:glutathione peroxidase-family protein
MSIYDFKVVAQDGSEVSMEDYKGKVLVIVNTATGCGFTPQYNELQTLYAEHQADGLEILDFPCNQFGNQAPGTDGEIHEFCTLRYKITFPQFTKIDVNGDNAIPLYKYLTENTTFEGFGMVEIVNNTYTITNWEKHQNVDKMDEIREYNKLKQRESRAKRKLLQSVNDNVNDKSMTSQPCQDIEEEGDKEKESHSIIHSMREEAKLKLLGGSLGRNVVLLSDEQFDDLCDNLSLDELNKYIGIVAECELSGKKFKKKSHYQAILDMVAKDRGIKTNERRKNK